MLAVVRNWAMVGLLVASGKHRNFFTIVIFGESPAQRKRQMTMALTSKDVLSALASFRTSSGIEVLKAGYIQDVAVEPHAAGFQVNIHVDDVWRGEAVKDEDRQTITFFIKTHFPDVQNVRIIPRSREKADAARKIARPSQSPPRTPPGTKMIAVISGKGGVGKSTVSINLARSLADLGFRTAILDCDIYGFSVPDLLQIEEPIKTRERQFIPPHVNNIDVMSMKFFVGHNTPVMWRGPMLGKAIRQMMEETLWNQPEYMVLDLPPGTGDIAMDVHDYFPKAAAILVTTPDANAAKVAERAGQMARSLERRLIGVVENMAYLNCPECGYRWYPLGQGGAETVAKSLQIPLLAKIPWVISGESGVRGLVPTDHPTRNIYDQLAQKINEMDLVPTGDITNSFASAQFVVPGKQVPNDGNDATRHG
ncbi:MAG: ATP-binding protein [Sulfobacillus benefaciens]|uniref:Iron-sulfur cluster carrier protein n=1 Tax=Sulfobacillus benefaciens TaxID=453960 RepID=A0A2T2XBN4_9FIRM|nr:MAG: ATP-binding protein [Sulfobacillus benefaciens]